MLITPHALTGAAITVLVPNPLVSVPLAIGSHFVLDMIPHWQETLYSWQSLDFLFCCQYSRFRLYITSNTQVNED